MIFLILKLLQYAKYIIKDLSFVWIFVVLYSSVAERKVVKVTLAEEGILMTLQFSSLSFANVMHIVILAALDFTEAI